MDCAYSVLMHTSFFFYLVRSFSDGFIDVLDVLDALSILHESRVAPFVTPQC